MDNAANYIKLSWNPLIKVFIASQIAAVERDFASWRQMHTLKPRCFKAYKYLYHRHNHSVYFHQLYNHGVHNYRDSHKNVIQQHYAEWHIEQPQHDEYSQHYIHLEYSDPNNPARSD